MSSLEESSVHPKKVNMAWVKAEANRKKANQSDIRGFSFVESITREFSSRSEPLFA